VSTPGQPPDTGGNFERPIEDAAHDLLGTVKYARKLAEQIRSIQSNYTVGIYGPWGAGKTSFVRLVEKELGDRVTFIEFSAWEYKTADELWRALIQRIAATLYKRPKENEKTPAPLATRLRDFLKRDAIDLQPSGKGRPKNYEDVMEALEDTGPSSIRKSRSGNLPIDEDQAFLAMGQAVAAAVASVSPLGGILRSLFGGEEGSNASKLLKQDSDNDARKRIDAIERYKDLLRGIFDDQAEGKRVCVFVDDLDRTTPDVAVDLLDAIQVFLGDIDCVFIVAADRELVGQGLKIRFKDLVQATGSEKDREFYARKGDEYIEKIIQFGVPVPQPTAAEAHRFIAARFPGWAACSDLINTALEGNPRRMQQYTSLLDYRHAVSELLADGKATPAPAAAYSAVFDKVTALFWRDEEILDRIRGLMDGYWDRVPVVEDVLRRGSESWDASVPDPNGFWQHVRQLKPVADVLMQAPLLSEIDASLLRTAMEFADVQPDTERTLRTRDRLFMRIMDALLAVGAVSSESILLEDLERLHGMRRMSKRALGGIVALAGPDYYNQMSALEARLEDPSLAAPALQRAAEELLKYCLEPGPAEPPITEDQWPRQKKATVRSLVLGKPRFSTILPETIVMFATAGDNWPSGESVTVGDLQLLRQNSPSWEPLSKALDIRIQAARRHLERRRFAKVDVMIHCWPELAQYLNYERKTLLDLEDMFGGGSNAKPPEAPIADRFRRWEADERFRRFLRIQPYLKTLYEEIRKVAAVTATPTAPSPAAPGPVQPKAADTLPQPESPRPFRERREKREGESEILHLKIIPTADGISNSFDAFLSSDDTSEEQWRMQLNVGKLLEPLRAFRGDEPGNQQVQRILADVGSRLFQDALSDRLRALLRTLVMRPAVRQRLMLDLVQDPALSLLPWDALYISELPAFPVLGGSLSVVRYLQSSVAPTFPNRTGPVKMLAVLANPPDTSLVVDEAVQLLHELSSFPVRINLLTERAGGPTTLELVRDSLKSIQPDIFFFFGHSSTNKELQEGSIMLSDKAGHSTAVGASELDQAVYDAGVSLAVLMGSETAGGAEVGMQNSLAGRFVTRGVPAAIGSVRPISKSSALMFMGSFFPALFKTGDVETAMTEARRGMNEKLADWSAYGLFSSVSRIENVRLLAPPAA
jgi:hypothetical protein